MLKLELPGTTSTLIVKDGTEMYFCAVEVFIGSENLQLHKCERRLLPLYGGEDGDDMERVNLLRMIWALDYIERCENETILTTPIKEIRLHLSPERNGWHTMFEIRIADEEAKIHVCNPSWPVNAIAKLVSIDAA